MPGSTRGGLCFKNIFCPPSIGPGPTKKTPGRIRGRVEFPSADLSGSDHRVFTRTPIPDVARDEEHADITNDATHGKPLH